MWSTVRVVVGVFLVVAVLGVAGTEAGPATRRLRADPLSALVSCVVPSAYTSRRYPLACVRTAAAIAGDCQHDVVCKIGPSRRRVLQAAFVPCSQGLKPVFLWIRDVKVTRLCEHIRSGVFRPCAGYD